MPEPSEEQIQAYKNYASQREKLLSRRAEIQKELTQIEKDLDIMRTEIKPLCYHPTKVDPRYNVCAVCYDLCDKKLEPRMFML